VQQCVSKHASGSVMPATRCAVRLVYTSVRLMTAERNVCCSPPLPPPSDRPMHFQPTFLVYPIWGKLYTVTSATIRAKSSTPTSSSPLPPLQLLTYASLPQFKLHATYGSPLFKFRLPRRNSEYVRCCIPSVIQLKVTVHDIKQFHT